MRPILRHLPLPLIAGLGLLSSPLVAADEELDTLRFGIISTESSQNQAPLWRPFLDDMAESLGVEVEPFFANDYAAVIQAMRFDQIDLAWYGNKSAMEAVDRADGEVFAQTVSANGDVGYWGLIIVNQESPYETIDEVLADADELIFANGDPNSTSGYLVPGYYIFAQRDIDPNTAFRRTLNANHETNALSVANGQVDVATFFSEGLERLKQTNPAAAEKLRVVWTSPLIPSDPLVWRQALPEELKTNLRNFLFEYGETDEQREVLAGLQWSLFQPSDNDQLLPIRQLELFKERATIAGDDSLADETRESRLAELDAQLDDLNIRLEAREAANAEQDAAGVTTAMAQ